MIRVERHAVDWERKMHLLGQVSKLRGELVAARPRVEIVVAFVHALDPGEKERLHLAAHRNPLWPQLGNSVSRGLLSLVAPMFVEEKDMRSDKRRTASGVLEATVSWLSEKGPDDPYHYAVFLDLCKIARMMKDLSDESYMFIKYTRDLTYDKLEAYVQQIDMVGQSMREV